MALIVLVADSNMEALITGLLSRMHLVERNPQINPILDYIPVVHPLRDAGVYNSPNDSVAPFANDPANKLLVVLDHEFGNPNIGAPDQVQEYVKRLCERNGWEDRVHVVVCYPEIDSWVWVNRNWMNANLGFRQLNRNINEYLTANNFTLDNNSKPDRPKEAFEFLLEGIRRPRSSSIYRLVGEEAGYLNCTDPAFLSFRNKIIEWFAIQ